MIRVLLADDQPLVREGWSVLLSRSPDVSVVGEARDGKEAVELASRLRPDVILMDLKMPRLDGLEATRRIVEQQAGAKILVVTSMQDEALIRAAMQEGACGCLSKDDMFKELLPTVLNLQAQQPYFSQAIREQYPDLAQETLLRALRRSHVSYDPSWVSLNELLERASTEAHVARGTARLARQESQHLCVQSRATRAFADRLFRLRHPDQGMVP